MSKLNEIFNVSQKRILITGATGFIGRYITSGFLENGAQVIMLGRSDRIRAQLDEYESEFGKGRVCAVQVDFYQIGELRKALEEITEQHQIDVLVNNAYDLSERTGFNTDNGRLERVRYDVWLSSFESGIYWAALTTQILIQHFQVRGIGGAIINIGSMYGVVSPDPKLYEGTKYFNPVSYGVGKAGLLALTRYTAAFLGSSGIRCNAISPGAFSNTEEEGDNTVEENDPFIERLRKKTLLNRIGHPRELIGALLFLASDASSYMTGQNLIIDGGWTVT